MTSLVPLICDRRALTSTALRRTTRRLAIVTACLGFGGTTWGAHATAAGHSVPAREVRVVDIEPVWSGHPVNFTLLTHGDVQFAAFYDASRQMTLAQRKIGSSEWQLKKLPTHIGWDSHNSVTLALDRHGILHVTGNMHNVPLIYFRSTQPLDVSSLEPVQTMTGQAEDKVTYPVFLHGPANELIFSYRNGRSGRGDTFYNVYDEESRSWRRLLDQPILNGEDRMNAYPVGPIKGPDGYFHLSWVWRDTSAAETNHDLSYARSRDLLRWEAPDGRTLALPLTLGSPGLIVDPVPVNGGIINSSGRVGFDAANQVIMAYHKFDDNGKTQLYLARFENGVWRSYQASEWDHRWEFSGGGSIVFEIRHGSVSVLDGRLVIPIQHVKHGSGLWEIDPATMKLTRRLRDLDGDLPAELTKLRSDFPSMEVKWAEDSSRGSSASRFLLGPGSNEDTTFLLRWETLPFNRDRPRSPPWPEPTMLQLVELRRSSE